MPSYVNIAKENIYVKKESAAGTVPSITADEAIDVISADLSASQTYIQRSDKTGNRTFRGIVDGGKRGASFSIDSHLLPSGTAGTAPDADDLFEAAFGSVRSWAGANTHGATPCTTTSITFAAAQNLIVGDAISDGNEIRFITAITGGTPGAATAVTIDPPLTVAPGLGAAIEGTVSYSLAETLPSVSIFRYSEPSTALQQILNMGLVEEVMFELNGDVHSVKFTGPGQQIIDSASFENGQGGLSSFPAEPASQTRSAYAVAGHFGQLYLGSSISKFLTIVSASLSLKNNIGLRSDEFGSQVALGYTEGIRDVSFAWEVYELDDAATRALWTAARNRTAIKAFGQMGSTTGKLAGFYIPTLVPQVPSLADSENGRKWRFSSARASNTTVGGELYFAFA